ncbi:hypothetical protein [Lactiplantibacillus plantarum]
MISTITLDTYKQQIGSGDAFNLSDSFNGRVGDEQVPLVVQFKERGLPQQFGDGLVPFLSGFVGSLDENNQVTAATGEAVSYVGTSDDIVGLGRVKMNLPGTMFPQEGYFYGFLGLQNADGKRVTTFNVWFRVYNGNPDMFVNKAPFRTELQKVLDTAQSLINDSNGDLNKWKQKLTDLFSTLSAQGTDTSTLLTTLQAQIKQSNLFTKGQMDELLGSLTDFKPTGSNLIDKLNKEFSDRAVNVEWFGAVGDGKTDDTAAVQSCIDYASKYGYRVTSTREKVYATSATINIKSKFDIDLKGAMIKPIVEVPIAIQVDCMSDDNGAERQSQLSHLAIDCTNTTIGLSVKARRVYLKGLDFTNCTNTGLSLDAGYEISVSSCNFYGAKSATKNVAIALNTTDNYVSHCFGTDNNIFAVNNAAGNIIESCHAWIFTAAILPGSVFVDLPVSGLVTNCVSDTYAVGFRLDPNGTTRIISNNCISSTDYYNSKTTNMPPTFIEFSGAEKGKTYVYNPTIANNWVSFAGTNITGFDVPGYLYNIEKWQVLCHLSGNTGYNVDFFDSCKATVAYSPNNIATLPSSLIRKNGRVDLIMRCAFSGSVPTTDTVVGVVPEGFRPWDSIPVVWALGGNINTISAIGYGFLKPDGSVIVHNSTGNTALTQGLLIANYVVWEPGIGDKNGDN